MAVIRRIQAERSFDIGGIPSTQVDSSFGQGLQQVGAAISDYAETRQKMETRLAAMQMENEDFAQAQELVRFKTTFAGKFAEMQTSMDPKGLDFAKKTLEDFDKEANTFLAKVPRALQPKYSELISTARTTVGEQAVAAELDRRDKWFATGVADRTNELGAAVAQNPDLFELSIEDGNTFIDSTGWPQIRKQEAKKALRQQLELAKAGYFERVDPDYLLGPQAKTTASDNMLRAIESVESSGDPNAVSSAGATGLMQVMPETAREIARELGDTAFPHSGSEAQVRAYIKNPAISRRYGSHYFGKMLQRYGGDTEAALVAYNAGPGRADRWINSGRDDGTIPAETRAYKRKVMAKASGFGSQERTMGDDLPIITRKGAGRISSPDMSGVQPVVLERFKQVQNVFGRSIPIVSGFRDAGRNKRAGGAKSSQHNHGNALDLDVSDMSNAERIELIKTASALGFTGIGVYQNSIHLDVGNRRAWGPSHHGDSVPGWAKSAISEHMAGTAQPQGGVGGDGGVYLHPDFANLPLSERLAIRDRALAAAQKRDAAEEQERQNHIKRMGDALDLGIETGTVTSREDILSANLPDDKTATLLRRFDQRNKDDDEARALLGMMATNGQLSINPFDSDQRKLTDNAYKYLQRMTPPDQMPAESIMFVERTGVVPDPVQAQLRAAAASTSAQDFSDGMAMADQIERLAPMDFRSFDGGKEVRDKLALYRDLVNNRGLDGVTAAQRILDASKPERVASREVLKDKFNTEVKKLAITDVTHELGWGFGFGAPDVPLLPQQQNVMLAEYRSRFEEYFYSTAGDADQAKTLAKRDMLDVWKPTRISGEESLMRMAPELYYPAINGGHEYLRDSAMKTAQEYVGDVFPGREVQNVTILASDKTRADVEARRPPRYRLFYEFKDQSGISLWDEVLLQENAGWGVSSAKLSEMTRTDAVRRETNFLSGWTDTRQQSDAAIQQRQDSLDAFIDGDPLTGQMRPPPVPSGQNIQPPTHQEELSDQRQELLEAFRDEQGMQ